MFFKYKNSKTFLDFISRVAISSIFISAIPGKINGFEKTVEYISSKGIPSQISSILLVGAIICLTFGSGFFIFGGNQKIGAALFDRQRNIRWIGPNGKLMLAKTSTFEC